VVGSFTLWYLGLRLSGQESLLSHTPIDQHTRQARAWLKGRITLPPPPDYLDEIAEYKGKRYNSFPPTPSLVEVPFVLAFGVQTPTALTLYLFCLVALIAQYRMAVKVGLSKAFSVLISLGFLFGTNLYTSLVQDGVWSQGQIQGYAFAILGLFVLLGRAGSWRPGIAYALLSLAVGCRPFYLFYLFLFLSLDRDLYGRSWTRALADAVLFMGPALGLLAAYNFIRFDNILEFGHSYLPWSESLPHGVFSIHYLRRNLYHCLLKLPSLNVHGLWLDFDGRGTAFWLNNGLFLVSLLLLTRKDGLLRRQDPPRWVWGALVSLLATWGALMLHESNGWYQFGYRYSIDVLPIGFVLVIHEVRKLGVALSLLLAWSVAINAYGVWWFRAGAPASV